MRVPQINLIHLFNKYSDKSFGTKSINYEDYDGFILTHFQNENEINEILSNVKNGKRLVFIQFNPRFPVYKSDEKINPCFFDILKIDPKVLEEDIFIHEYGFGKIIFINGALISDYALDSWRDGRSPVKEYPNQFVKSIITSLKQYDIPYFTADIITQPPKAWLVNETFFVSIQLLNIGKEARSVKISLSMDDNVEPLSSTELYFNSIDSYENKTVNFFLKSRKQGVYKNYLSLQVCFTFDKNLFVKNIPIECETNFIFPNVAIRGSESIPNKEGLLNKYQQLRNELKNINNFDKLIELIEVDPSSTIAKARTILEKIVNKIIKKQTRKYGRLTLKSKVRKLKDERIIDNKIFGWINTVRILANYILHPENEIIIKATKDDALLIVNILLNIIEELLDRKLV